MNTTFTIQSVHGLKQSFVLVPNGSENTVQPSATDRPHEDDAKAKTNSDQQAKPR